MFLPSAQFTTPRASLVQIHSSSGVFSLEILVSFDEPTRVLCLDHLEEETLHYSEEGTIEAIGESALQSVHDGPDARRCDDRRDPELEAEPDREKVVLQRRYDEQHE